LKKNKITKKMTFGELLNMFPESSGVLVKSGMHCIGCPMAMAETIEDGARVHGINPDDLIRKLNTELNEKMNQKKNEK